MNLYNIAIRITFKIAKAPTYGMGKEIGRAIIQLLESQFNQSLNKTPEEVWQDIESKLSDARVPSEEYFDVAQDLLRYIIESKHDYSKADEGDINIKTGYDYFLFNMYRRGITQTRAELRKEEEPVGLVVKEKLNSEDIGRALDESIEVKRFMDLLEDVIPDLKESLSFDQNALFDLIFYEDIGTFKPDIKSNMAQASELRELFTKMDDPEAKKILKRHHKRWSGYVGDLRKKLLDSIHHFITEYLTDEDYDKFYEAFFSDITPLRAEKYEKELEEQKEEEVLKKVKHKLHKLMEKESLTPTEKKNYDKYMKQLRDAGVEIEEEPITQRWVEEEGPSTQKWIATIAARVVQF